MGAVSKLDLTSDVTHLIVGDVDTPKYKYVAKEREDVKVLGPQWVHAVREKWMDGGELNIELFEQQYRLPTFMGLKICVTGFEELEFRKQIEETVKANGGEYRGDLTKEITHLIAYAPSGQKYRYAKQWGMKIVTIEWFKQSLERGMILEETLYDPLIEPRERGRGAWNRRTPSNTSLGKRRRGDDTTQVRRLRRSASSKFDSQNDGFWTDIVSAVPVTGDVSKSKWDETTIEPEKPENPPSITLPVNSKPKGIFSGKKFLLHGFDKKQVRRKPEINFSS
jgi:DNA replication regulator DPB11